MPNPLFYSERRDGFNVSDTRFSEFCSSQLLKNTIIANISNMCLSIPLWREEMNLLKLAVKVSGVIGESTATVKKILKAQCSDERLEDRVRK